jgi:hypothetical protein
LSHAAIPLVGIIKKITPWIFLVGGRLVKKWLEFRVVGIVEDRSWVLIKVIDKE